MRYIQMELSQEESEKREKKIAGDPQLQNGLFGDKEVLLFMLQISPLIGNDPDPRKSAKDLSRYAQIDKTIMAFKDPGYLEIAEDDWQWVSDKINHNRYVATGKDQSGNEVPIYTTHLKRLAGLMISKWDSASTSK